MSIEFYNYPPLLSIVMPVHNPHQYIYACLESILQQTFCDFELIAIDDGSSDNSYAVLKDFEARDKRLMVLHNNQSIGAARTRNRGLYAARGKYIMFLDADDYFELDYFEKMVYAIESARADVAICRIYWRDECDGTEIILPKILGSAKKMFKNSFHPSAFNNKIFYNMQVMPFNKIIRRELLIEKNLTFQNLNKDNDVFFGFMVLAEADSIVYLSDPYVHYRYNTGMQISASRQKNPLTICYAFEKIREELIMRGLWDNFSKMYNDISVASMYSVASSTYEPNEILNYIRYENGTKLGLSNLSRNDFSSLRYYGEYNVLFYGKRAILHSISDIFSCTIKFLMRGEFSVLYWFVGYYFVTVVRLCKRKIMKRMRLF